MSPSLTQQHRETTESAFPWKQTQPYIREVTQRQMNRGTGLLAARASAGRWCSCEARVQSRASKRGHGADQGKCKVTRGNARKTSEVSAPMT